MTDSGLYLSEEGKQMLKTWRKYVFLDGSKQKLTAAKNTLYGHIPTDEEHLRKVREISAWFQHKADTDTEVWQDTKPVEVKVKKDNFVSPRIFKKSDSKKPVSLGKIF